MWGRTLRGALSDEGILPIYIGKSERWRDFQAPEARIEWVRRGWKIYCTYLSYVRILD